MRRHNLKACGVCGESLFAFLFTHHHNWRVQRCISCGLVQVIPRPTKYEVKSLYHEDMEHYDPYLEQIEVHREYFKKKISNIKYQISNIQIKSKKEGKQNTNKETINHKRSTIDLLDVGCAIGVMLEEAQKVGFKAYGIDISKDAVKYCQKHGLQVISGALSSNRALTQRRFDVITAFEVIEHEYDPLDMVKRIYKLLKLGGIALITTPNHDSFWRSLMGKWWFGYQHPEHFVFFEPASMKHMCKRAGFSHVEVMKDDSRPFPLSFAITRTADYFPVLKPILVPLGKLVDVAGLKNPINPFSDMMVVLKK